MSDVVLIVVIPVVAGGIFVGALVWYGLSIAAAGYREAERLIRIAKG